MNPVPAVLLGVVAGTAARLYLLRIDYRIYPSYPQGYVIHVTLGAIAAFLGAVAVPAVAAADFQAATFLALAATQFREVRNLERETLQNMESTELVPRGDAYIEGIARVFEARNYLALTTALLTTLTAHLVPGDLTVRLLAGAAVGLALPLALRRYMQGLRVGDIAEAGIAPLEFDGPMLKVDGVPVMNVGLEAARKVYREHGLGVVIKPRDANAVATLANTGQRQAIAHDTAGQLGVRKDIDEPEFTPLVRRDSTSGALVLSIVPAVRDAEALLTAVRNVPVLEGAYKRPLASRAGKLAH